MAASFNSVTIVGNVTRDPELKITASGSAVADVGVAINSRRKGNDGQWVEETTFVDVTFWKRDAEILAEYVRKGDSILVDGRLKLDTWERDGKRQSKLSVVCERLVLLGGKKRGEEPAEAPEFPSERGQPNSLWSGSLDDCPF